MISLRLRDLRQRRPLPAVAWRALAGSRAAGRSPRAGLRLGEARCEPVGDGAGAAASCGSRPLARNAATIRSGRRRCRRLRATAARSRRRRRPGPARRRACLPPSGARPRRRARPRGAPRRGGARRPPPRGAEQPRQLAAVRRHHGRRGAYDGLELPERVRVDDDRQLEPFEQHAARAASSRRCGRGPDRARRRRRVSPPRAPARRRGAARGRPSPPAAAT